MERIRTALIGIGNCASALIQGISHYRSTAENSAIGLMHQRIGGFNPDDIHIVAAFDVDSRKVGLDLAQAVFAEPNCTKVFAPDIPATGVKVRMGRVLDGVPEHMADYPRARRFEVSSAREPERQQVIEALQQSGAEIMVNYLPVGAEEATRFYAECALQAGVGLVNAIPVFIASDPTWAARFAAAGLPLIGDDIKSQLGATITHRALTKLFRQRGVELDRTYQLNTGGNTDFLNMLNRDRLRSKRTSKTEAVQAATAKRLAPDAIHVGPSDYVSWQKDQKICFIRMEGRIFGDLPINLEVRLSVEDSPNSAGVAIDAIRCAKLALMRGDTGVLHAVSACFCKHPPHQLDDDEAHRQTEAFIANRIPGSTSKYASASDKVLAQEQEQEQRHRHGTEAPNGTLTTAATRFTR